MQRYTVYFIRKLLYIFRVVPSLIIRSVNNCIYSHWYLSRHYVYLPLLSKSCLHSWWWVMVPPETCRAVSRENKLCNVASPWMWVPVTTAWRVLRLRMEERPPLWRVAVNKLNKQPRTADGISSLGQPTMGGPPAWGLGEVLTTPLLKKLALLRNMNPCLGPGLIIGTT